MTPHTFTASSSSSAALPWVLPTSWADWTGFSAHAAQGGVVFVFTTVYLGMFLGGLPCLKLDGTGVAVLRAIAVIALTGMTVETAARAVDLPTILLLFAFMLVSEQLRLGGFYTAVTAAVGTLPLSRPALLAALIAVAAALSAVFSNDVICPRATCCCWALSPT